MKTQGAHIHILTNEADEFVGVQLSPTLWKKVAHYVYQQAQRLDYEPFAPTENPEPNTESVAAKTQKDEKAAQAKRDFHTSPTAEKKEEPPQEQTPTTTISIIKQEENGSQVVISKKITTQKKEHNPESLRKKLEELADFLKNSE